MGSVRTSILRRPRPLPPHRRADHPEVSSYTLDWEEPHKFTFGLDPRLLLVAAVLARVTLGTCKHSEAFS